MLFCADLFWFVHSLIQRLLDTENTYSHYCFDLLLLFCHQPIQENLYMIHHGWCLSYWILKAFLNTLSKIKFLSLMDCSRNIWYLCRSESKGFLMISCVSLTIVILLSLLLVYIVCFLLLSVDDINLNLIGRCIFHSPEFSC